MSLTRSFTVSLELDGQSLASVLRGMTPGMSWSQAKRLIVNRHVLVNGSLSLNDARRLREGEVIEVHEQPRAPVPREQDVRVLHIDPDLIVIDKPPGIVTLRRDEEAGLSDERRELQPTLDELVLNLLPVRGRASSAKRRPAPSRSPLHAVHRLDRDTSGLMLFALSTRARDALIEMFKRHEVRRLYWAAVNGTIKDPRTIDTELVRDRGDGLRGSIRPGKPHPSSQRAITHIHPVESIDNRYTLVECRLETGRTHQIRIHLSEIGHMLCGEKLYLSPRAGEQARADTSGAPRQALHSRTLELVQPSTGRTLRFESPLPADLSNWLEQLRRAH